MFQNWSIFWRNKLPNVCVSMVTGLFSSAAYVICMFYMWVIPLREHTQYKQPYSYSYVLFSGMTDITSLPSALYIPLMFVVCFILGPLSLYLIAQIHSLEVYESYLQAILTEYVQTDIKWFEIIRLSGPK